MSAGAARRDGRGAPALAVDAADAWSGEGLAHECLVHADDELLVQRAVPFLRDAYAAGQPTIAVLTEPTRRLLLERLGPDLSRIARVIPAETWWVSELDAVADYHQMLRRGLSQGDPWRVLCEPIWMNRPDGRVWSSYEAVLNHSHPGIPFYALCVYDARVLSPEVVATARLTHPLISAGGTAVRSSTYQQPESYLGAAGPTWTAKPATVPTQRLTEVSSARAAVRDITAPEWVSRRDDIALAVHELVANSVRASGSAEISCWVDGERLVWEVADSGPGLPDPLAGYWPPDVMHESGRGLWMARHLADAATVRRDASGTAVRLFFGR